MNKTKALRSHKNATQKTLLILKDRNSKGKNYLIDEIASRWENDDYEIVDHFGWENIPEAEITVLHFDQTRIQTDQLCKLTHRKTVLNREVTDISKQCFSQLLVSSDDPYQGKVIVKTNLNFGGIPEFGWFRYYVSTIFSPFAGRRVKMINPYKYPVFDNKEEVPETVWQNKNLIVEKFLPEFENGLFYVRCWVFLGDQNWAGRFGAREPIVKFSRMVTEVEEISVPDELLQFRMKNNLDYGRIDFVMHDSRPVVLDVNKTIGCAANPEPYNSVLCHLAKGFDSFANQN